MVRWVGQATGMSNADDASTEVWPVQVRNLHALQRSLSLTMQRVVDIMILACKDLSVCMGVVTTFPTKHQLRDTLELAATVCFIRPGFDCRNKPKQRKRKYRVGAAHRMSS